MHARWSQPAAANYKGRPIKRDDLFSFVVKRLIIYCELNLFGIFELPAGRFSIFVITG